ncbi:ricin-type beta-trefoil lectin domain protein [Streptomyces cyaneofuscatus]|uniref:ricin-type beta-trefoil lectin domain protein n=1 Tax=Streptomyces cyaneofuscatus TaxID=66883 RepID=UPI00368D7580
MRLRRARSMVVLIVGASLLGPLVPTQAAALPPGPAQQEVPREDLVLEKLPKEQPVNGSPNNTGLASLASEAPQDQQEAPAGTATPPTGGTAQVSFGAPAQQPAVFTRGAAAATPAALEPAGSLPVKLGRAPGAALPTGTWQVGVLPRTAPEAEGVDGAIVTVTAPATGSVPVSVQLDYRAYQNLYGADWASRLSFVQFPECYLSTPELEECRTYDELETVNDTSGKTITATVDPAAGGTATEAAAPRSPSAGGVLQASFTRAAAVGGKAVIGAVDSGSGEGGSFKATPLNGSGTWAAGSSSGGFTWSYPLAVPPTPAGPLPKISFDYNSQTVDGKTASTSPQASWVGEGWSYDPGHIERRYRPCKDDTDPVAAGAANNTAKKHKTSDLCWASYNAVMTLGGRTTELVRIGTSDLYRPQRDDGSRIELRTGGDNPDNNGEHWVVTTTDGVKYYYGLNKIAGHADTDSVSTVPVFGNHPGEPCHAATFAASRCNDDAKKQQAWSWGLDKVVDLHGNVMIVNWHQSLNHYAVNKKFKSPEKYSRGALPDSIEYGMREGALNATPAAKIDFLLQQRCLQGATVCASEKFDDTKNPPSYRPWWDSPGNLNCKADSKLCPAFPSFWNRLRLGGVTTYAHRPGTTGLAKVDTYQLKHSFPRDWYDTAPGLWLNSITRYGFGPGDTTGTVHAKGGVSFHPYVVGTGAAHPLSGYLKDRQLPNLVPRSPADPRPGFTRPRIGGVSTEHGGDIEITYKGGCKVQPDVAPENNKNTCFPVRWSPDPDLEKPPLTWFNKYVVHTVTETDKITGVSDRVTTRYDYTAPAWGKSDDEAVRPAWRTHSEWRGYQQVSTAKGSKSTPKPGAPQTQSYSVTRYFRGVGGPLKDSKGVVNLGEDEQQYAGMAAETLTYDGTGGKNVRRALNFPWSTQTASRNRDGGLDPLKAFRSGIRRTDEIRTLGASWQGVRSQTEVDATTGLPVQIETTVVTPDGTGEKLSAHTCTTTDYVAHPDAAVNIIGLPRQIRVTATPCARQASADPATEVVRGERISYDNGAWGAAPSKGLPTAKAALDASGAGYAKPTTTTFDPLGRPRKVTDPLNGVSETQYTPGDEGGPITGLKKINAKGHATTTTIDPGRGLTLTSTDANKRVLRIGYDALGRLTQGWSASRSAGNQTPDVVIDYQMAVATPSETRPTAVTVRTLKDDGVGYARQVTIYDGLMRPVQRQAEAHGPGRTIVDTRYDDRGNVWEETDPYLAKGEPETRQFKRASDSLVPSLSRTAYDGLGRMVKRTTVHNGKSVYADVSQYGDNWSINRPAGGATPAVRTYTDAQGRVSRVDHSVNAVQEKWRTTTYGYDARGNRTTVEDHAKNKWTYTYDARGLLVSAHDPDIGSASFTYDDLGRQTSATDAQLVTTYTEYDAIGRVLKVREGSKTADPVKEFTYDMAGALGKPVASVRHDATGDWITRVTGYDTEYRATGREVVVPEHATTAGVSGTYRYSYGYTPGGKQISVTVPAVAGLSAEKVITRYDADGLPESTSGHSWYTSDATYSPYGEPLRTVSGPQPYRVWTTNFVDQNTGRLQRTVWDRETADSHRISDSYYSYDRAGNVTSAARKQTEGATSTWDNQCFTYDYLGELVHAWTSKLPVTAATGCKARSGTSWGYRSDGQSSSGPTAEAADAMSDATAPDNELKASLEAAAPATGTVETTGAAYWQSFTFDAVGNRASHTDHHPTDAAQDRKFVYGYGTLMPGNGTQPPVLAQPHILTSIDRPTGADSSYVSDLNGNTTDRGMPGGAQRLAWNAEKKVTSVTGHGDGAIAVVAASGKCLDLQGNATADGTPVQVFRCNNSGAQQWSLTGDTLRVRGKCAAVNGTLVQLASCSGAAAQKFTVRADKTVLHAASGKCLGTANAADPDGTDLQVYTCSTGTAQKWTPADKVSYVYDAGGNRILKSSAAGSTLYLSEVEVSTDPLGAPIQASRTYEQAGAPTVVRTSAQGSSSHRISVLLADPVGTATTAVQQSAGQPVTRRSFKPYGEKRTTAASWPNSRSYVGTGVDDTDTGLTNIGAREYDQSAGRFLSADPIVDFADPLQINGYAYSHNNPVTKSDPDGLLPIECWEGIAVCSGGKVVGPKGESDVVPTVHPAVKPEKALTEVKENGKRIIYDEKGVPHTVGKPQAKPSERIAIEYMNNDLGPLRYDEKTGNGTEYLWQDESKDSAMKGTKGLVHDANGNHRAAGATADFIKVTWKNGKVASVETWDATDSQQDTVAAAVKSAEKTINNKLNPGGKTQTQNVVFVANSVEQWEGVRDRFVGNANVRVIFSSEGRNVYDTHPSIFKGIWAEGTPPSVTGRKGGGKAAGLGGKVMNGAGALDMLGFVVSGVTSILSGCDGMVNDCGPPSVA